MRTLLIALAAVAIGLVLLVAFALLRFSGCSYDIISENVSPSGRYVARWLSIDCGMNAFSNEVLVQDRWFPGLPALDGKPAGARVTSDFLAIDGGSDMAWEGDVLVLHYPARSAPELDRRSVGGARVETRPGPR
ncbi:hypothetical protein [Terricaulis silvestris]|nr:hypothetical protein [Terricaulis silvestris]